MEKQESISRQSSSILKPPKQRQPLQCVATNPSSSENSPTIKIKRRVSFAKNKRIREFCNEAEQGTVWDNTYEEHDLSNSKNNSNDHPVIISVPCNDKENFPVQLFLKNDELNCKEVSQTIPTEDGDNLSQCDMEMDNSLNNFKSASTSRQNQYQNETIYCDDNDGMDMTNYIPSEIIPCQRHDNDGIGIHGPGSQTCIQNISMEVTQSLPLLSNNLIQQRTTNKNLLQNNSTELTQAISTLLSGEYAKKLSNPRDLEGLSAEPSKSIMDCSNTAAMEFTSILPSSTWIKSNSQCQGDDRTENLNKSMEITMAVPYTIQTMKEKDHAIGFSEKTNIFTNKSMEITEPIITKNKNDNCETDTVMQEKTKLFLNNSMEMTQPVSIFDKIRQIENNVEPATNVRQIENNVRPCAETIVQEKTKIFVNNSMEMTEAVSIFDKIRQIENNVQHYAETTTKEKSKIFVDNSMEITEAIPILNKIQELNNTQPPNDLISQEKTQTFVNNSMEITKAVPVLNKEHQLDDNLKHLDNIMSQEKTKIFLNNSMEMTEAIPNLNKVQVDKNSQLLCILTTQEKTKIFANNSMEMTEAVPILSNIRQLGGNTELLNNVTSQEKTKIFLNNSMEMTEAIPNLNKVQVDKNSQLLCNLTTQEKTKIFANNSMEMTEAVPILSNIRQLGGNTELLNNVTSQEKTKIFLNNSMEMTEAVPNLNKIRLDENIEPLNNMMQEERTKVFINNSMEMTEAVSIQNKIYQVSNNQKPFTNSIFPEKTKLFSNVSMEITEAVPVNTNVDKSMEMTQNIAISDKLIDSTKTVLSEIRLDRTKVGINMSMEMTEAVLASTIIPTNIELEKTLHSDIQKKTTNFLNKSMDVSEIVPILNKCQSVPRITNVDNREFLDEKTKLFLNTSMEMTEAVTTNKKYIEDDQIQNKTRIFVNKSVDISETVPIGHSKLHSNRDIEKIPFEAEKEATNISCIDSIIPSKTVPVYYDSYECKGITNEIQRKSCKRYRQFDSEPTNECKKISPNVSTGKEKTKILHERSIESTETISLHQKICEPSNLLKENLDDDRTEYFPNRSMDITENIPVKQNAFPILENQNILDHISQNKTKMFTNNSMDISETIPVIQNTPSFNRICSNNMDVTNMIPLQHVSAANSNNQGTRVFLNKSKDITETITSNKNNLRSVSLDASIPDEGTQIFSNAPMDFTSQIPTLPKVMKMCSSTSGNNQSKCLNNDATKIFHDATMEFTELPSALPNTSNNPKMLNRSNFGISPNNINVMESSINVSNNFHKRSNYDISDRYSTKDENFHRITSDELNTLCASMNLPTQKYSRDESENIQTNFIPSCNDVNVLRDSLQKNSIFQIPEQFNTEVSSSNTNGMKDSSLVQVRRERLANIDLSIINRNEIDKSATINYFNKSVTGPVMDNNLDKTVDVTYDQLEQPQTHCDLNQVQSCIMHSLNGSLTAQSTANVSNHNSKNVYTTVDCYKDSEKDSNAEDLPLHIESQKLPNSKLQIYHDTSMELTNCPLTLLTDKKSNKIIAPITNCNENENCSTSRENSLSRLPSDNTDLLIATMGFKTKLTYPLIINDKTTITVSNKSMTSKSHSISASKNCSIETNKTYVIDKSFNNHIESKDLNDKQIQNEIRNFEIPAIENDKCTNDLGSNDSFDKENSESDVKFNLFPEKCLAEDLDEIQPPSFLDSDSMQDDLSEQLERLSSDNRLDSILSNSNEQNVLPEEAELRDNISFNDDIDISKNSEEDEKLKRLSSGNLDYSLKNKSNEISFSKENKIHLVSTLAKDEIKKDSIEEPISPFVSLTQSLKAQEIRDDCIWAIRVMKSNVIAIDFISKSFVVVIRLNEMETINCIRDVEKIEFISRISANSTNIPLKIVHRLLLLKLNPDEMAIKYKMYEDILPMLQYISEKVVFSMNFMFDLERLTAMNIITVDIESIMFMVSSRKSNIILKVLLSLKLFHEIGPNDIDVTCVLGDIRKNDIKQLIVNIKKDYKFLSRYINDVKDYITLMENHL